MKVFISWSGDTSRQVAQALREWLPMIVQGLEPFVSSDIHPGSRWLAAINSGLEENSFGIACMTPANLDSTWIHYEAGAIAKAVGQAHLVPLLYDVQPVDLRPPLSQFQAKSLAQPDVKQLIELMNELSTIQRPTTELDKMFLLLWPELEEKISSITSTEQNPSNRKPRTDRELLEEILALVRQPQRKTGSADLESTRIISAMRAVMKRKQDASAQNWPPPELQYVDYRELAEELLRQRNQERHGILPEAEATQPPEQPDEEPDNRDDDEP